MLPLCRGLAKALSNLLLVSGAKVGMGLGLDLTKTLLGSLARKNSVAFSYSVSAIIKWLSCSGPDA